MSTEWLRPVSMEVTFQDVDPATLGLLTGGVIGEAPPEFSIEVHHPVRRTFWQWLLRRPRRWRRVHVPRARLTED